MAASTGIVVTAGSISLLDEILTDRRSPVLLRISVATAAAAFLAAGLDKAIPGLGTGTAALLLLGVLIRSGPTVAEKVFPGSTK